MSGTIKIEISDEPTSDIGHRFRNFGEDVYRSLREMCSVSTQEIDTSTMSITIRDIHRRDFGLVTQTIKRELRKHRFEEAARLIRL